ncbi:hypothetical protein HHK36_026876 [Tetracentron sinense]|uniref:Uncharacterized protein n=1 Tax=Tetracentron sinense TaxID=13715 RepID=A0A834YHP4_TETSI|nr:hypothetical protein HHK36_026876 [Tetracentron sinense]
MADAQGRNSGTGNNRRRQSRLQRRAPASIEVSPASSFVSDWKVAIPLLSPLVLSPSSPKSRDLTAEVKSGEEQHQSSGNEKPKPIFKKWQHPAAPLYCEPAPMMPSLLPRYCR